MRLLAELEVFAETARLRSFGKAAAKLNMTPSTLTRRVAALESDLGVSLILRSTRSFALTPAGQKLFDRSRNILEEVKSAREELRGEAEGAAGHMRIGAPADLVCTMLMPLLARHARVTEGLSLSILSTEVQPDLGRDSLDLAFVVAHQKRLENSAYVTHPVGSFARMLYASQAYVGQRGTPKSPQDLPEHLCIRHWSGEVETQWDLFHGRRKESVLLAGSTVCSSVLACAQAAREDLGIAMLPAQFAVQPLFGGGLVRVLPRWVGTTAHILAITSDRTLSAKARGVIAAIRSGFEQRRKELELVDEHAAVKALKSQRNPR